MASGHLQGRLLKMLVQMIRPKNILEVGTFSGYSAICLAEGLAEGGVTRMLWLYSDVNEIPKGRRRIFRGYPLC